jgi:hypothetical protein
VKMTELGRVAVGETYRFHRLRQVKVDGAFVVLVLEGDLYRVTQLGYDGMTRQETVFYVGVDGLDEGKYFHCSPMNFVTMFRPEAVLPPRQEPTTEAPAQPTPLISPDGDGEFWQKIADSLGGAILVLASHWSVINQCEDPCATYCVAEADADEWQRKSFKARYAPRQNVRS